MCGGAFEQDLRQPVAPGAQAAQAFPAVALQAATVEQFAQIDQEAPSVLLLIEFTLRGGPLDYKNSSPFRE
jgi:hypothetical protein